MAGFSLVEILVAAAMGSVVLLGFTVVFQRYQLTQKKVAAVLLASGAEVDLILQIENPLTPAYQVPAIRNAITSGLNIPGIQFPLHFAGATPPIVTANGTPVFVKADGTVCATNFTDPTCVFSVQISVQLQGGRHVFSYQINVNETTTVVAPLGNIGDFATFAPIELYQPVNLQHCDTALPPVSAPGDISVRGINRATGQVYCIRKPTTPCAPGTFPMGTSFVDDFSLNGNSGGRLEVACVAPPVPAISCAGAEYVLNSFGAGASGTSGTCIFRTASPQAWPTTYRATKKITVGRGCPTNYNVVPNCWLSQTPPVPATVTCGPYTTGWTENCQAIPNQGPCAIWSTGTPASPGPPPIAAVAPVCISYTPVPPTYEHHMQPLNNGGPQTFPPPPGPVLSVNMLSNNSFECVITYPDLPHLYKTYDQADYINSAAPTGKSCNPLPIWTAAEVSANFSCVLNIPETIPAN